MDSATIKESRRVLRLVQEHLYLAHNNLGVQRQSVGLVDVLYHPTSTLASLNYVTPRRNTAWVSGEMVAPGLVTMRQLNRTSRVHYIEGLFPPLFAKTLRELGLQTEWELPLMIYLKDGFNGEMPPPAVVDALPAALTLEMGSGERGTQAWWHVWRSGAFEITTLGIEPLFVGRDLAVWQEGIQIDVLLRRGTVLLGVARLSIQEQMAHLLAMALLKEARTPDLARLVQTAAVEAALAQGCTLVYTSGASEADRQIARSLGFMDFGSIVCYAANIRTSSEVDNGRIVGQPVFALR